MKTNIKNTLKIILAIILVMTLIKIYDNHKAAQREEYAQKNNCTWTIYGAYDICK